MHFVATTMATFLVLFQHPARGFVALTSRRKRSFSLAVGAEKRRVVFLGSPGVAASTLARLLDKKDAGVEVVAAVSQPPARKGRKKVLQPCEVQALAESRGLRTMTPAAAKDPEFLVELSSLAPDLCITAAFGQFLPKSFLEIPKFGTWNIHPSLLPKYRGAAPLQRSLENGDDVVGVTVLETVLKMDAGPIVAQKERIVREDDTQEALLEELFATGLDLLADSLPGLWDGTLKRTRQDENAVTQAPKLQVAEAELDLRRIDERSCARRAADKVRAFSPWPGTWIPLRQTSSEGGEEDEVVRLKVLSAREGSSNAGDESSPSSVKLVGDSLRVVCPEDMSSLDLVQVQPPNRKPMSAKAYWNGLRGKGLEFST